ncbi:MAG: iron-sulfur cluster-binding protein [Gammaproteobacteria bacterium]|nr:MAG: iron-sulfur cluster-binding protein [Gammaproteobacteria bacterium]
MKSTSQQFSSNAQQALHDTSLQQALQRVDTGFVLKRKLALNALPDADELRQRARAIKEQALSRLDEYLLNFEKQVQIHGGQVHWAQTAAEANAICVALCQQANARSVIKGKTMVGEETGLSEALEQAQIEPIETDLGEYIIQLAKEPPSHIIVPALHKTRQQIIDLFMRFHDRKQHPEKLDSVASIVNEARAVLRNQYLEADVGITGANFLIAETGTTVLVTNEGNGDLCSSLPSTHIIIAGIEKIVPTLDDAAVLLRLLARNATGQDITAYTSFFTGARRDDDPDGPENFHIILVDNGRSDMLHGKYRDMLRCIRCGACMNHCPVYGKVGGHAYGWVYPGPMGSVLTPLINGLEQSSALPNASTFCGRCEDVCPMSIPLPELLRQLRNDIHEQKLDTTYNRILLTIWSWLATHPRLYRIVMRFGLPLLRLLSHQQGRLRKMPGLGGWLNSRDLPAPTGSFMQHWQQQDKRHD